MLTLFKNFVADESGVTAIEYGLLAALIAVAIVGTATALGTSLNGIFSDVSGKLTTAAAG